MVSVHTTNGYWIRLKGRWQQSSSQSVLKCDWLEKRMQWNISKKVFLHIPLTAPDEIFPLPVLLYDSQLCFLLCPFVARKEDAVLGSWIVLLMTKSASLLALICFWWALCWAEGSVSHRGECEVYSCFLVDVNKIELRGWLFPAKYLVLLLPLSES